MNFSEDRLKAIHNDVLANNYGNLVNRVLSLWIAYRENGEKTSITPKTIDTVTSIIGQYKEALKELDIQRVFAIISDLLNEVNGMLNTTEPWKKSGEEKGEILVEGIAYVYYATLLLSPFIPTATAKVMQAMGIDPATTLGDPLKIDLNAITKPAILFEKK